MPRVRNHNTRPAPYTNKPLHLADRISPEALYVPRFITNRHQVTYDHLPRPAMSPYANGTMSDRIGWVLLHPDLQDCVRTRTQHIPDAAEHVRLYRDFARIASYQTRVVRYIQETEGPPDEKTSSLQAARMAYDHIVASADYLISRVMVTDRWSRALGDLLPRPWQHATTKGPMPEPARNDTALVESTKPTTPRDPTPPPNEPTDQEVREILAQLDDSILEGLQLRPKSAPPQLTITTNDREMPLLEPIPKDDDQDSHNSPADVVHYSTTEYSPQSTVHSWTEADDLPTSAIPSLDGISLTESEELEWEYHIQHLLSQDSDFTIHPPDTKQPTSPNSPPSDEPSLGEYSPSPEIFPLAFGKIDHVTFIGTGRHPWCLIRLQHDKSYVLVHENDFPARWPRETTRAAINAKVPFTTETRLHNMQVYLEDAIARYLNVKALRIGNGRNRWNENYRLCIEETQHDGDLWNALLLTSSVDEVVGAVVDYLHREGHQSHWNVSRRRYFPIPPIIPDIRLLAIDLDTYYNSGFALTTKPSAVQQEQLWLVRHSDGRIFTFRHHGRVLEDLVYAADSVIPVHRMYILFHLHNENSHATSFPGWNPTYLSDADWSEQIGVRIDADEPWDFI